MSIIFSEGMGEKVKGKDEKEEEKNKLESSTKRERTQEWEAHGCSDFVTFTQQIISEHFVCARHSSRFHKNTSE